MPPTAPTGDNTAIHGHPGAPDDAPIATAKHAEPHVIADALDIASRGDSVSAQAVTINRPVDEVFAFWRDVANLATFMDNVVRVEAIDACRSHWVVRAPAGRTVEWDAEITAEEPDRLIAWASVPGADVAHSGRVEFRDAGARGTVVTATILYDPPGGAIGKLVAKLFQREPAIQSRRDLRRLKQLLETGEIATAARTRAAHAEEMA